MPAFRESPLHIESRLRTCLRRRLRDLPDEEEDLVPVALLALHLQRGTSDLEVPVRA